MNRTWAIVLTIVSVVLCGCPGLLGLVFVLRYYPSGAEMAAQMAEIQQQTGVDWKVLGGPDNAVLITKLLFIVAALIFIVVPIVVGLITFRAAKKKAAALPPAP